MKIYLLVKESVNDFDIISKDIIGANFSEKIIDSLVSEYNATRTNEEIRQEIEYIKEQTIIVGE
ncbi:MAG TPA: hypothetical protein VFM18_04400 [Methanosarcina sp.]|nr:hypothetical protein [Methanosarcina sp.]